MNLNKLLQEKNITQYRLSKITGIGQATVSDICTGKTNLEKCSAITLYLIAQALGVSMESLIKNEKSFAVGQRRIPFELFKSNICHLVKEYGDVEFLLNVLKKDEIRELDKRKWYPECFYLLAMVDYLSNENNIALCNEYDDLRKYKLEEILYPSDVLLMDKLMKTDENRKQSVKEGIPEFMNFNIVESDIRNVI